MQNGILPYLAALALVGACSDGGRSKQPAPSATYAVSAGKSVSWKRYAPLEADLMQALELGRDQVCQEAGARNCIRDVHLAALGGNDPFAVGLMRPPETPLATTPLAVDRVLLSACSARAHADAVGPASVFTELNLQGPAPAPDDPAAQKTIAALFRRLVARDPQAHEVELVGSILNRNEDGAPASALEFATLACFAIGSSVEFLFY